MDYLQEAKMCLSESENGMEWDGCTARATQAQAYAAIAQAEASRPRFVRLGDHTINLAHIAYIDWHKVDREGNCCIEITFLAVGSNAALGLKFRDEEVEPVAELLRQVIEPYTVAALDFPEMEAQVQATAN